MANVAQFENCPVTISRIQRASKPYKAVWVLEGLNDETTREQLVEQSHLNLKVGDGENEYDLQFGLKIDNKSTPTHEEEYISITAGITSYPATEATFDLQIVSLSDSKPSINREVKNMFVYRDQDLEDSQVDVDMNHILLLKKTPYKYTPRTEYRSLSLLTMSQKRTELAQVEDFSQEISKTYRLGIIVTPLICNSVVNEPTTTTFPSNLESELATMSIYALPNTSLAKDLEQLYLEGHENNFSDLKLETKDGVVINAHKFILAARCSAFRELIDMALKQNGFDGTIIIKDINAKPLMAILHWMYTGKLQDGVEKFMGELVEDAALYEIQELLEMLDNELIKICNKDNMFELFQTAKQNKMENAVKQISKFIKQNI